MPGGTTACEHNSLDSLIHGESTDYLKDAVEGNPALMSLNRLCRKLT